MFKNRELKKWFFTKLDEAKGSGFFQAWFRVEGIKHQEGKNSAGHVVAEPGTYGFRVLPKDTILELAAELGRRRSKKT